MEAVASALLDVLIQMSGRIINELQISNSEETLKKLETTTILARELFINHVNTFLSLDVDDTLHGLQNVLQDRIDSLANHCSDAQHLMEKILERANDNHSSSKKKVFESVIHYPRNLNWHHNIGKLQKKLDNIVEQVKSLAELASNYKDQATSNRHTDLNMLNPLIGRERDMEDIIQKLILDDSGQNGVSILGIDGLGKTMLAEAILLYNRISEQFYYRLRVPLLDGIFKCEEAINELIKLQEVSAGNNGVLELQNRRLLILFDNLLQFKSGDYWINFWGLVKNQGFADTDIKILVTTFAPQISEITNTTVHYLKRLSEEDCKNVIVKKALLCKQNLPESHLSRIAGNLARKCEGLPLVARALGIVLAQHDMSRWGELFNRDLQELSEVKRELRLSYPMMTPQVKRCLAYFSLFPHKYCFQKNDLIHLWVGQEIILQGEGDRCFSSLQGMSILQHSDDGNCSENPTYELHKFSYIFSKLDASNICLQLQERMSVSSLRGSFKKDGARHLSLSCSDIQPALWDKVQKVKYLRTFLTLSDPLNGQLPAPRIGHVPPQLFKALTCLRVLSLKGTNITELPDSIYRLKYLRYLDISFTPINKLPDTLCKLSNLKILKLKGTEQLFHLPNQFQKLTNLSYIDWELHDIVRLALPSHIGKLSNLRTLPLFNVGDDQRGYSIAELKDMNSLEGSICIRYLENIQNKAMAEKAMLSNKISLNSIALQWNRVVNDTVAIDVLTGLKPSDCLTELTIRNYGGNMFPDWISDPSRGLQKIHLMSCPSCDVLPSLGVLETLETLVIENFANLTSVDRRFCGPSSVTRGGYFTALKSLTFKDLAHLQEWTGLEANDMRHLRILKIIFCSEVITLPSLKNLNSLVELEIVRCQAIRSLPELPQSIESLKISESNLLKDRCTAGGEDWQKVDCIPKVEIDGLEIQTSGFCNDIPTLLDDQQQNIIYQGYQLVKDIVGGILSRFGLRG